MISPSSCRVVASAMTLINSSVAPSSEAAGSSSSAGQHAFSKDAALMSNCFACFLGRGEDDSKGLGGKSQGTVLVTLLDSLQVMPMNGGSSATAAGT